MIHIQSSTIAQAWRDAIEALHEHGKVIEDSELFRDSVMTVEVDDTTTDHFDDRFPMARRDMIAINDYLAIKKRVLRSYNL